MKIFCILFFLFFLHVEAQRRAQTRQEITNGEQPIRSRGRSRFSNPEYIQLSEETNTNRRISSRRRPDQTIQTVDKQNYPALITPSSTPSYAVEEIVDETDQLHKPRVLTESKFEAQNLPQQPLDIEVPLRDSNVPNESIVDNSSLEEGIPTVQLNTNDDPLFREDLEPQPPKINEKVVPITRSNVRTGSSRSGNERRTENRNGNSRFSTDRGSRNGNSRTPNEKPVPSTRNGFARPRPDNFIPSRRNSIPRVTSSEDLDGKLENLPSELPSTRAVTPSSTSSESEKDENEIRKEIVRNSVPNLPQRVGIPDTANKPSEPRKPFKKTIRTRVHNNPKIEEPAPISRTRPNGRIVENYEPAARPIQNSRPENFAPIVRSQSNPKSVEEYSPPSRGRTIGSPREVEFNPSQRTRSNNAPRNEEPVPTARSRTRPNRKNVEAPIPSATPRTVQRGIRRRPETTATSAPIPRRGGPSVFTTAEENSSTRPRTGRRIGQDQPVKERVDTRSFNRNENKAQVTDHSIGTGRRQSSRFRTEDVSTPLSHTLSSRHRFNGRSPINIDESKLEVLPLFEGETKIISQPGDRPNQLQFLVASVTESENKVLNPPEIITPAVSTRSGSSHTKKQTPNIHSFKRKPYKKTEIRESVISQVSEVTSKRTVSRKTISKPGGRKFSDIKSNALKTKHTNGLTSSEEDISDSDNYPEPFKSLIQSKKHGKESRPSNAPDLSTVAKKASEKFVSSSEAPRSALATPRVHSSATISSAKYGEEFDNEVHHHKSTTLANLSSTRKRFNNNKNLDYLKNKKSTTVPRKSVSRSTLAPTKEPKEHKFHSRVNSNTKNEVLSTPKSFKGTPTKSVHASRKHKYEKSTFSKARNNSLEIGNNRSQFTAPPILKTSRYSSRYRSSSPSRTAARTSTQAPVYIPTIPAVRSYTPSVRIEEDPDMELDYITIDAPVRSISSANLINGELRPSSDANSNALVSTMPTNDISGSVNSSSTTTNKPDTISTTLRMTEMIGTTTVQSVANETNNTTTTPSNTVATDNVVSSSTTVSTTLLPSLSELLNGNTVQAFNSLVNNTSPNQESTTQVIDNANVDAQNTIIPAPNPVTATPLTVLTTTGTPSFLNTILSTLQSIRTTGLPSIPLTTTIAPVRFSSTYRSPVFQTTQAPITTVAPMTTTNAPVTTTRPPTTAQATTPVMTTTSTTTTTTAAPVITTASVANTQPLDILTPTPYTSKPAVHTRQGKAIQSSSTVFPYFSPDEFPLLSLFSTERPRRTNSEGSSTTKKISTNPPTTATPTTTAALRNEVNQDLDELLKKPIDSIKPKKQLTEQQKKDLEVIRQLEKEQAAILKQLSFLTNLNLNQNSFTNAKSTDSLANRIVALAKERDSRKVKSTTTPVPTTTRRTTAKPSKATKTNSMTNDDLESERMKQIENLIKLLNMNGVTPSPNKGNTYGTSNDAILATLLKERGIGPSTPKQLAQQIEQFGIFTESNEITTVRTTKAPRKPKTTTPAPRGPILSWLLNAIAPPAPTKAPARKPKPTTKRPKPKPQLPPPSIEQDILTNEPTHITPVVTPPPSKDPRKALSQEEIQKLIKQLEAIQRDPSAAKNLDLSSFKNLQNLNRNNVQVFMPGASGISQRETTKPVTRAVTQRSKSTSTIDYAELEVPPVRKATARAVRTSTHSPAPVSNSIFDDTEEEKEVPISKGRATLPPVKLRPVSGVSEDAGSMVRGRLLTAAVNVTRAISGFLGNALQGAASSFQTIMASGSRLVGNFAQGSSATITDTGE